MVRALFVDRDGTVIIDRGYPKDPADVELLPGAGDALRAARALGFRIIMVSNQSGVARGLLDRADVQAVHQRMAGLLALAGAAIDGVYYCFHGPDDRCACRKPEPGLLRQAAEEHGIDLARSYLVGDKLSDVDAGLAVGCTSLLLAPAAPRATDPERPVVHTWLEVVARLTDG